MKRSESLLLFLLIVIPLTLIQCSTKTKSIPATANDVSVTPLAVSTRTAFPTSTLAPSPTVTITPIRTLTAEQRGAQFETMRELIVTPFANCDFPCFWGITPGKTSWSATINFLEQNQLAFYEYKQAAEHFRAGWQMFEVHAQNWMRKY